MKIFVKAKPGAKTEKIVKMSETNFKIAVKERPQNGKANAAILRSLADYFKVAPSRLKIISGSTAHNKIIEMI